jgi:phosphohistidine phosphatase SixA
MRKPHSPWKLTWFLLLLLAIGSGRGLVADDRPALGPRIVMIIRHAEKPEPTDGPKDPNLSPRGFERADALAKVIPAHFPKPDYLIATKRSKNSNRPVETITPLSKALHEEIASAFADKEYDQLAHALLTDRKYAGKVVLIAWHHGKIPELAKALGAKDVPEKWDDDVFDRLWEIDYKNGEARWKDLPEHALPGDSDKAAGTTSAAEPKANGDDAAQLKAAQEERIKTLAEVVEMTRGQAKLGTADVIQVFAVENELCNARLDATENPETKVVLLTKLLEKAGELVEYRQLGFRSGTAAQVDVSRAKAIYLEIKIRLLRERRRIKPAAPAAAKQS